MSQYPRSIGPQIPNNLPQSRIPKQSKTTKVQSLDCLETQSYPEFKFQDMFSMLVVGPSQCGKTYFVQQLLTKKCIEFPEKKPVQIYWFYNQWQERYDEIKQQLKNRIRFTQGLPELSVDLHEISPEHNNILVFDDLMAQAADSPVLSRLFTQGRHRNASVILLLQNAFPKGKFNTDINRNATYKVLFRSPGDRKQIDITAEQTFAKDRANFMKAYTKETEKPFGYIILDNRTLTSGENQVVANVFNGCYSYPRITKTDSQLSQSTFSPALVDKPTESTKRKTVEQIPVAKKQKQTPVKRQVKRERPVVKKQKKLAVKRKPTKKSKKRTKPRKQAGYQSEERFTGGFADYEEQFNPASKKSMSFQEELIEIARQAEEEKHSKNIRGFRHR